MTTTTETTLTFERADALLAEIVAEAGDDYTYPMDFARRQKEAETGDPQPPDACFYFVNDQPSCIVGHLLHRLGFGSQDVKEGQSAGAMTTDLGLTYHQFQDPLANALDAAQRRQDAGGTWGESLDRFRSTYRRENESVVRA